MYEISSDSDEEWYDKCPKKLERLRTKYGIDNFKVNSDEVLELIDSQPVTNSVNVLNRQDSSIIEVLDDGSTNLIPKEMDPPYNGVRTRSSRNKRKNSDEITLSPVESPQTGAKRGRGRGKNSQSNTRSRGRGRKGRSKNTDDLIPVSIPTPSIPTPTPSPRRGGRGRGGRRGQRGWRDTLWSSIITYSVGNTDEYPDASDDQPLFNHKKVTDPIPIVDLDESMDNEELSVKVLWQHLDVFKFNIRRYQKLTQIFDFFVKEKDVSRERLLFTYNNGLKDNIIRPDDTPDSIDYNIAKFIEGGITNRQIALSKSDGPKKKGFVVKFQCQNKKKPLEVTVGREDKLQLAMVKFAEHLEMAVSNLVFEFDGETINGTSTPNTLEMESGDCIDVKIM